MSQGDERTQSRRADRSQSQRSVLNSGRSTRVPLALSWNGETGQITGIEPFLVDLNAPSPKVGVKSGSNPDSELPLTSSPAPGIGFTVRRANPSDGSPPDLSQPVSRDPVSASNEANRDRDRQPQSDEIEPRRNEPNPVWPLGPTADAPTEPKNGLRDRDPRRNEANPDSPSEGPCPARIARRSVLSIEPDVGWRSRTVSWRYAVHHPGDG